MENYVAPQGEIQGGFTAPQDNGNRKEKRDDIQLLPAGPNSGVIFALVDLGTHMESFQGGNPEPKRKILIGFEHPQLKQCFYKDDPTVKSSATWLEGTLAVNDKAKLRKIIEAVLGKSITDQEAYAYDISKMLGARLLVNIKHQQSKKDGKIYEKVESVMAHGQMPLPVPFQPENEYWLFNIDPEMNNFKTINFAKLPAFLKKKILASDEAKKYIANGGVFAQMPKQENNQQGQGQQYQQPQQQAMVPQMPQQPQSGKLVMLVSDFTYEQYIASGWTDETLVANGRARIEAPVQQMAPPPAPMQPQATPSAPQAPQPVQAFQQPQQVAYNAGPVQVTQQLPSPFDDNDSDVPF